VVVVMVKTSQKRAKPEPAPCLAFQRCGPGVSPFRAGPLPLGVDTVRDRRMVELGRH
jgi:hypothetical protein